MFQTLPLFGRPNKNKYSIILILLQRDLRTLQLLLLVQVEIE
jgi:hypothetical protein